MRCARAWRTWASTTAKDLRWAGRSLSRSCCGNWRSTKPPSAIGRGPRIRRRKRPPAGGRVRAVLQRLTEKRPQRQSPRHALIRAQTEGSLSMLILTRRTGESLRIGDDVEVTVMAVNSSQERIGIQLAPNKAPHHVEIPERKQRDREPAP